QNGMFLPAEGVFTLDAAERAAKADQVFMDLLRRFTDQKRPVGPNRGKNYAPARFAEHPDAGVLTSKDFARAMQRLLDAKTVCVKQWGSPSRRTEYLEITKEG